MTAARNVIFIMADQLPAGCLGCYGGGVDSTPALDRMANEGIRFDRCYSTVAVCAPNRASILTGRSALAHGVITNNLTLQPDTPTWAHVLRQQRYRVGGFGKFHVTSMGLPVPESLDYLGFDEVAVSEDPRLGPWLDWIESDHPEWFDAALATCWPMPYLDRYGPGRLDLRDRWKRAFESHLRKRRESSLWHLMYTSPLPPELGQTAYITDRGLDFMRRHLADHPDRPFCCMMSYVDPHDPYDPPKPYDVLYDPADMPPPRPAEWKAEGSRILERSKNFGGYAQAESREMVLRLRALYHGSLRYMDDQISRVRSFMEQNGLLDNTVLVFTTDHGEMLGDHGLITKGVKHYDWGVRNPLIAWGAVAGGRTDDRLVCGLDFFPTFCDWARVGGQARPPVEGLSFAPACEGDDTAPRWKEVTVESAAEGSAPVRSVITDDGWRLTCFNREPYSQMFNLRADPEESRNLWQDAAHAAKRVELLERMARAYARPGGFPQYRNYVEVDGRRGLTRDPAFEIDTDVWQPG